MMSRSRRRARSRERREKLEEAKSRAHHEHVMMMKEEDEYERMMKEEEERLKASFEAFEETELPMLKEEKPGRTLKKYKEMIWKLWNKSLGKEGKISAPEMCSKPEQKRLADEDEEVPLVGPIPKELLVWDFFTPYRETGPSCILNETEFNEVALRLAEDEDYLNDAKEFLESLQGDEPRVNVEAWTSLSFVFRRDEDDHQLLKETANWIAFMINADPSLKSASGERKPVAIMRFVLSILTMCWHSISVPAWAAANKVSDSATFFNILFHDLSMQDLARELAQDIDFVQEAHKFMEPLVGDRPVVNIYAWTNLSHRLVSALDQCSLSLELPRFKLKQIYKYRAQTVVQARKLIAVSIIYCINSDPSLKPLLGERHQVHLIRFVTTLLITFWRDEEMAVYVEDFFLEPMSTDEEDQLQNPRRKSTDKSPLVNVVFDSDSSTSSLDYNDEQKRVASSKALAGEEECASDEYESSLMGFLVVGKCTEVFAGLVSQEAEVVEILKEFLETLSDNSQHDALQHFDKVKKVFENHLFIRILLKFGCGIYMRDPYLSFAGRDLAEFLNLKMRRDPSFKDIFIYKEPADMLRSALSILVGYWSNLNSLSLLVCSTGSSAFGVNIDDFDVVVKEEEKGVPVCSSLIVGLCQDASIKELADQLSKIPQAVASAKEFLESLRDEAPVENLLDRNYYHTRQFNAACEFWYDPVIVLQLVKAFKKSTRLFNVLKKYSKGAQLLRCEERMARIKRDPLLRTILEGDQARQISGALSILIAYWNARDVVEVAASLNFVKSTTPTLDLSEGNIEVFDYLTECRGDVESLKHVLADKHPRDSRDFLDRFDEIKDYQEAEEERVMVEPEYRGLITVVLKNGHVIHFQMRDVMPCS